MEQSNKMTNKEEISEVDLEKLWHYFHEIVDNRKDAGYENLQIAGLMMAYSLKLYRFELSDQAYKSLLNYIFEQHKSMLDEHFTNVTIH